MVLIAADAATVRLNKLLTHVEHVRDDCLVIGTALIAGGEEDLGRLLIANGRSHDTSKFSGIEWDHLGVEGDPRHHEAWLHHVHNNLHHPEAWAEGIHRMERVYVAEMICDWKARSNEFATSLRDWIVAVAMPRYGFAADDRVGGEINEFLAIVTESPFK